MNSSLTFEEWLRTQFRLIAGGEGEGEGDPTDGGEGDPSGSEGDPEGTGDPAHGEGEGDPEGDPETEPTSGDDDELDRIRKERDDVRTQLAKAEAAAQKAKQEARKAREEAAKKGGNWEAIAKERATELEEANEKAQNAEQRAITAEENLDRFQREVRITRIAAKLSFRDPQDAIDRLEKNPEVTGDDKSCDRALRNLAKEKPYLIDERRARGRAMSGNGGQAPLTVEQMRGMSREEINEAWEKGLVQQSLGSSGGG